MVLAALLEYYFRRETTRVREYAAILFFGLVMGLYGMLNDMVTGSLSPDYFIYGKGVPDDGYRWSASVWIGGAAGISGGFVIGAILVCLRSLLRRHSLSLWSLASRAWVPVACGIGVSTFFFLVLRNWDVIGIEQWSFAFTEPERQAVFLSVWWEHFGVYVGSILGTLLLVRWVVTYSVKEEPGS
jgi:hypothetical protein